MLAHDRLSTTLQSIILKRIEDGNLVLPTMPRAALKVKSQLEETGTNLGQIGKTLESDPLLAAQILRLANSALYKATDEITSLSQAITRLGVRRLKEVLYAAVARPVFRSSHPKLREALIRLWDHSLVVADVARDIHGISGGTDSELAFLAGLLHDIGKAIAGVHLVEVERRVKKQQTNEWIDEQGFLAVVNDAHRPIGAALAREWSLPAAVAEAIEQADDYDSSDRTSPVNAVRFGNALAKQNGFHAGYFDGDRTATEIMVGRSLLGIDDEVVDRLIEKMDKHRSGHA